MCALRGNIQGTTKPFMVLSFLTILAVATTLTVNRAYSNSTVGLVCVSAVANSCPAAPAVFTADPGSQLRVRVVTQSIDAFDSYSVAVGVNQSILKVASVDATGGLLQNLHYMICTGENGDPCGYWLGLGPGDVRVSASGMVTQAPTTGLLFTLTYIVLARTAASPIVLFDQVSPSGWSCGCALFSNSVAQKGFMSDVQGGSFANPPRNQPLIGDMNHDCVVNILDIGIIARAFDLREASNLWNPKADLNHDGMVNILDVAMAGMHFDQRC